MKTEAEEFRKIATANGIETVEFKEMEDAFARMGYKGEEFFSNGSVSIIKTLAASKKEGNAIIDASEKDKLAKAIDTEILYLIVEKETIKNSMFEAFKTATKSTDSNYLLFIGAESKTADIEKQLVSGVQGAKRVVFVLK